MKMILITRGTVTAQACLHFHTVSPEPSLFAQIIKGTRGSFSLRAVDLARLDEQLPRAFSRVIAHVNFLQVCFFIRMKDTLN